MIIEDDEILEYLEHHGVKGMRWGVRSAGKGESVRTAAKRGATKPVTTLAKAAGVKGTSEKSKKRLTKGDKVVVGLAAAGIGYTIAHQILKRNQAVKMREIAFSQHAAKGEAFNMFQQINSLHGGKHALKPTDWYDLNKAFTNKAALRDHLSRYYLSALGAR